MINTADIAEGRCNGVSNARYGKWVVLGTAERRGYILCKCDCGTVREVRKDHLKDGRSRSCGCIKKEQHPWIYKGRPGRQKLNKTYGNMISRCYNPKADNYQRYHSNGITVCEEWRNSFDAFADWAYNNGYADGLTLDRVDNAKGYSPDNCRWATAVEQANNRSTNIVFYISGERKTAKQIADMAGIKAGRIYDWIKSGVDKETVLQRCGLRER